MRKIERLYAHHHVTAMEYALLLIGLVAICIACIWAYDRMAVRAARDRVLKGHTAPSDPEESGELRHEIDRQRANRPNIGPLP